MNSKKIVLATIVVAGAAAASMIILNRRNNNTTKTENSRKGVKPVETGKKSGKVGYKDIDEINNAIIASLKEYEDLRAMRHKCLLDTCKKMAELEEEINELLSESSHESVNHNESTQKAEENVNNCESIN